MTERQEQEIFKKIKQVIHDRSFKEEKEGFQTMYRMNENDIRYLVEDVILYIQKSFPQED